MARTPLEWTTFRNRQSWPRNHREWQAYRSTQAELHHVLVAGSRRRLEDSIELLRKSTGALYGFSPRGPV